MHAISKKHGCSIVFITGTFLTDGSSEIQQPGRPGRLLLRQRPRLCEQEILMPARHLLRHFILLVIFLAGRSSWCGEISFVEDFALAPDRSVPLKQLVPGTEPYYYFHCLHLLNT